MPMRFIPIFNSKKERTIKADSMIDATMKIVSTSWKKYIEEQHSIISNEVTNALLKGVEDGDVKGQFQQIKTDCMNEYTEKLNKYGDDKHWTSEQKTTFYRKLLNLPASEQNFLLVYDNSIENVKQGYEKTLMDAINFKVGFNALSRLYVNDKPMRMIPSRGMMQAYLEAVCPAAPYPIFRFGLSSIKALHNTLKANGRDLFQNFALLPQYNPLEVDSYRVLARYAEVDLHDFYHQMRISHIPLNDRQLFNDFADKLLDYAGVKPVRNNFARALALKIIDMEHPYYDENLKKLCTYTEDTKLQLFEPEQRFWQCLDSCARSAASSLENRFDLDEYFETLEQIFLWIMKDNFESEANRKTLDSILDFKTDESKKETLRFSLYLQRKFKNWFNDLLQNSELLTIRPGF